MESGQPDAQFAQLAEERLDRVAVARDPEPLRLLEQVMDPLGCFAVRHRASIMAQIRSGVAECNA